MRLQCRAGKERLVAGNNHIGEAEQHRHHLVFQHIVGEVLEHLVILILVHIQAHAAELAGAQGFDQGVGVDQPPRLVLTRMAESLIMAMVSLLIM